MNNYLTRICGRLITEIYCYTLDSIQAIRIIKKVFTTFAALPIINIRQKKSGCRYSLLTTIKKRYYQDNLETHIDEDQARDIIVLVLPELGYAIHEYPAVSNSNLSLGIEIERFVLITQGKLRIKPLDTFFRRQINVCDVMLIVDHLQTTSHNS